MINIQTRYIEKPKSLIPKNAKIVFEGILFKVYNWEQKTFDNKLITFEAVRRQDNAQILLLFENKIILTKEMQPHFTKPLIGLPGGNVEWDETPQKGAIRETLEETGISIKKLQLFATDNFSEQKLFRNFYLYIGQGDKKIQKPQNSSTEKIELLELNFEEFILETQKKNFRNTKLKIIIKDLIKKKQLKEFEKLLFKNN